MDDAASNGKVTTGQGRGSESIEIRGNRKIDLRKTMRFKNASAGRHGSREGGGGWRLGGAMACSRGRGAGDGVGAAWWSPAMGIVTEASENGKEKPPESSFHCVPVEKGR
jgi:hypothetical protein